MSSTVASSIESIVLEEAIRSISKKVAEGKRLSDSEVTILILDRVTRRTEVGFSDVDKRFGDVNRRIDNLNATIRMLVKEYHR